MVVTVMEDMGMVVMAMAITIGTEDIQITGMETIILNESMVRETVER